MAVRQLSPEGPQSGGAREEEGGSPGARGVRMKEKLWVDCTLGKDEMIEGTE